MTLIPFVFPFYFLPMLALVLGSINYLVEEKYGVSLGLAIAALVFHVVFVFIYDCIRNRYPERF